ncbi:putative RelA/SpoT domain protein (plasmid) [Ochrobactrum quorumnocens]|uniref:Putative RelA/SpoT domain protein n=1 Tax=Ochrobactrum quorumnocens TaxID=271865 RepID=A0A248U8K9_9HYPH|nr:RelA/SpoT domain-containing protein [[Ochrobactrum] quorumnocens]ASV83034.1 putative RelA/SpoT domain protein [[Ochrobactrum] quorumnocens]
MTSEEEFLRKWKEEEPLYIAWGRFIYSKMTSLIDSKINPRNVDAFLRLPVKPRVKEADSLLQKAFYRQKNYIDPYSEIEDKIGLRFVVLLARDVRVIEDAILEGGCYWNYEKARDYEDERAAKPEEFGYQSVHYVLKSKFGFRDESTDIPEGLPCEVQVRTLLQHAYSELTHDTIYKPSIKATPQMKRAAAKSMALIEATDDYFTEVSRLIDNVVESSSRIEETLFSVYKDKVSDEGVSQITPLNSLITDRYGKLIKEGFSSELEVFFKEKPYIFDRIKERRESAQLYRVPAIILVYYCVAKFPTAAKYDTPLDDSELAMIYSDLGLSLAIN